VLAVLAAIALSAAAAGIQRALLQRSPTPGGWTERAKGGTGWPGAQREVQGRHLTASGHSGSPVGHSGCAPPRASPPPHANRGHAHGADGSAHTPGPGPGLSRDPQPA
jgi:hypothetical protein